MSKQSVVPAVKFWTLLFLFLSVVYSVYSQSEPVPAAAAGVKKPLLRVTMLNGSILRQGRIFLTSYDEEGHGFSAIKAASVEYGWQMFGGTEWHQTCNYPRLGFGVQYLHIMGRDELGHPFSLYGFYDGNYIRTKNFEFTNRLSAGFAYGFGVYDPNAKLANDIFCTRINSFVELGFGLAMRLHDNLYIEPGFRLTHFSNGNIREPQNGLNIVSYSIGLRSTLVKAPMYPVKMKLGPYRHRHEIFGFLGLATRQMSFMTDSSTLPLETYGMNFLMTNLLLGYHYEASRRLKLGGGLDFIFDGTHGQQALALTGMPDKDAIPFQDKLRLAVFISGETAINRLAIVTTLGYIIAQKNFKEATPAFQQRLGFKYYIHKNVFAGINVRAYQFRSADALEFNIGMRTFIGSHGQPTAPY